ncbi:N,N-dimethylformamidase beta subunit family domain-containing protein [Crenothrix sp.]|uniref:N,N-dimethylformamidase beta subunit family domain-containing protein n=1 Tax=Crenothrix sp. TaxID=3100433 RepID=UPI00374CCF36
MINLLQALRFTSHSQKVLAIKRRLKLLTALPTRFTKLAPRLLGFVCLLAINTHALALNRIQTENALPGTSEWYELYVLGSNPGDNIHEIEGYADKDSVNVGQSINLYVSAIPSLNPQYTINVYRLGWYGGLGARKVNASPLRNSIQQVLPTPNATTGLIQANWTSPYTLAIPSTWASGIYIASLTGVWTGHTQYIPFVVRDDNRTSDYLFQTSTTTWQAYNAWGGKSLYGFNSTNNAPARKVSFNRPYDSGGGLGALTAWDINMLNFMELQGYDVTYQTDVDTHARNGLLNHKAVLSVGHDEYWTKAMRDNFENARARGVSLGFFGANDAYWQIRMENAVAPLTTLQNRTIVGYKDFAAAEDPLAIDANVTNNNLVTSRWRNPDYANRPENALIGVMYAFGPKGNFELNSDILASKNDPWQTLVNANWIYTASGTLIGSLETGVFQGFLGYEADRVFDNGFTPSSLETIAASPVPLGVVDHDSPLSTNYNPAAPKSHATVYTQPCTITPCKNSVSTVFAAGSLQWVWGLDTAFRDESVSQNWFVQNATINALARMISAPLPATIGTLASIRANITSALNARDNLSNSVKKDNPLLRLVKNEHKADKQKVNRNEAKHQNKNDVKRENEVKGNGHIKKID